MWIYVNSKWYIVGGTSVATPTWAGIVNAANGNASSSNAELMEMYSELSIASDFYDIITGTCGPSNGYAGVTGWDPCTGIGAPNTLAGK